MSGNGEYVSRRELHSELRAMRWELRAWAFGLVLMMLWRLQVPDLAVAAVSRLIP